MDFNFSAFGEWLHANTALLASLAGSATSAYFTKIETWRERLVAFAFGGICAVCLADPVDAYLHLGDKATGYLMGFFGINICAALLKGVRRFGDDADFWTLFREAVQRLMNRLDSPDGKPPGDKAKE